MVRIQWNVSAAGGKRAEHGRGIARVVGQQQGDRPRILSGSRDNASGNPIDEPRKRGVGEGVRTIADRKPCREAMRNSVETVDDRSLQGRNWKRLEGPVDGAAMIDWQIFGHAGHPPTATLEMI